MIKMSEKLPLEGRYLIYKGKPLVREKNVICYGDMTDKCYLFMMILTNKKSGDVAIPDIDSGAYHGGEPQNHQTGK